jgi:hypothetical protein
MPVAPGPKYLYLLPDFILFLKVRSLSYGYSGVSKELVQRLINMFNDDVIPVMYEQGSLGASGDLAPLAHLSLPLIGEGAVYSNDSIMDSAEYLRHNNLISICAESERRPCAHQWHTIFSRIIFRHLMSGQDSFCVQQM